MALSKAMSHEQELAELIRFQDTSIKVYERRIAALTDLVKRQAKLISWMDKRHEGFYESPEWLDLRYRVLTHYGAVCMKCNGSPKTGAVIQVDHIRPRVYFPELALVFENLQVLCLGCNQGKGIKDMTDYRPKKEGEGSK